MGFIHGIFLFMVRFFVIFVCISILCALGVSLWPAIAIASVGVMLVPSLWGKRRAPAAPPVISTESTIVDLPVLPMQSATARAPLPTVKPPPLYILWLLIAYVIGGGVAVRLLSDAHPFAEGALWAIYITLGVLGGWLLLGCRKERPAA